MKILDTNVFSAILGGSNETKLLLEQVAQQ